MKIYVESEVSKEQSKHVTGTIRVGFSDHKPSVFQLDIVKDGVSDCVEIIGDNFNLRIDSLPTNPTDARTPQERAMLRVYTEVVFGQVQALYEKTSPISYRPHRLENEAIKWKKEN